MDHSLGLFQGFGIELEYMIVDCDSLDVRPLTDELLKSFAGNIVSDWEDGAITWSNELVLHVVELKTTGPARTLNHLSEEFHRSLIKIDERLSRWNARLLPTAMHPWMSPAKETKLWPHDNNEIYASYDRIFGCEGHGWSNLQSMHINLPFSNDDEFGRLHAAIRVLLPILPALTASSPVADAQISNALDARLVHYQNNQKRIPSIAGNVIPERAFTKDAYQHLILDKIYRDIAPHDPENLLQEDWLNSRGAIARWGRQTIEIRVLDTQECPKADLAYATLIVEALRALVDESLCPYEMQIQADEKELKPIFDNVAQNAEQALIENQNYLELVGFSSAKATASEIWAHLFQTVKQRKPIDSAFHQATPILEKLLHRGCLARAIRAELGNDVSLDHCRFVYSQLAECLRQNKLYAIP